jgi:hypothetical protein
VTADDDDDDDAGDAGENCHNYLWNFPQFGSII